jgi:hypothetical protein
LKSLGPGNLYGEQTGEIWFCGGIVGNPIVDAMSVYEIRRLLDLIS